MEGLFAAVNAVLSFVTPVSDFSGTFLRCSAFGKQSPFRTVLACHYCPCRIRAVFHFPTRLYTDSVFQPGCTYSYGQSQYPYGDFPIGCFCLSTAMRVGPGNIIGVTGAIAAGGPGALFWMWVSAFSVWRLLTRKVPWHRYSRKNGGKNSLEVFLSTHGVSAGTKCGSVWHCHWFISCMP